MDWSKRFFFFVVCVSGLAAGIYSSSSYPDLETAQRFEICVVGGLSRSALFTNQEKSSMSKILKETGSRMHNMGADPSNVNNARTMLRLFAAALANLVHKADSSDKRIERTQNYTSVLKTCSDSLPEPASTELTGEVAKILLSMESKKSNKDDSSSRKSENSLDKQADPSPTDDPKSKKRDKRSPQSFQSGPPLDSVITGVLITTPSFGNTFKDGLSKQDAVYYSKTIVDAGLAASGYYSAVNEAVNEVGKAMSNLFFPQTYDFAFAIGNSINTVLSRRGIANFADGVGIANAMLSKLDEITPKPNSDFSFPSSFDATTSDSAWDSSIGDTFQPPAPFQLQPSWDSPPAPAFQFDAAPKSFTPETFIDKNRRFPLNPSFNPNPVAPPLPAFDFGSLPQNFPDFSNPLASFPSQPSLNPVQGDFFSSPESVPDPFPVDTYSKGNSRFSNQPTGVSRANSNPFEFDGVGSQDFQFSSFGSQDPPPKSEFINQQTFQAPQLNDQAFQVPQLNDQTFQAPQLNDQTFQAPQLNDQTFQAPQLNQKSFQAPQLNEKPFQAPLPNRQTFQAPQPNDQSFQSPPVNQQKLNNFDLGIPQAPVVQTEPFNQPTYLQDAGPSNIKESPFHFDQTPVLPGIPDDLKTASSSQTASGQPLETTDPYVTDVTKVIENTLGLSEDFSSNFDQNLSPFDAASIATAMTRIALSQYDPSIVSDVEAKIKSAIYDLPTSSNTADYARTIANTFIKAMQENGLLNSVNSKKMADSLISGLKVEIDRRKALTEAPTSSLGTLKPVAGSDINLPINDQSQVTYETSTNPSMLSTSVTTPNKISSSASTSASQATSNVDFAVPLEPSIFVPEGQSVQLEKDSSDLDIPTTTFSPLDITEPMKLTSIIDILYTPFATTLATPTKTPYMTNLTNAAKNKDTLYDFLMDQVNSSLKSLNETSALKATKGEEFVPVNGEDSSVAIVSTNNAPSTTDGQELRPVGQGLDGQGLQIDGQGVETSSQSPSTVLQDIPKDEKSETEISAQGQQDELSLFAQRISSASSSTIEYIRRGRVNTDELCGKLNMLAFMADIPPLDNCTEVAMIDFLLNLLNAVIFTLRNR